MQDRRNFLKISAAAALSTAVTGKTQARNATVRSLGAVSSASADAGGLKLAIGNDVLRVQALSPHILRLDLLAGGKNDPHTPVMDPKAVFPGDPAAKLHTQGDPIRLVTTGFELHISRNPCRLTLMDSHGKILLRQTASDSLHVDPQDQAQTGFSFHRNSGATFYGIRNSACWSKNILPVVKDGAGVPNDTYKIEASVEGGGGAPFTWTTDGYGILVDSDGGYFHIGSNNIGFYYGNPKADNYGRNYFRPNSLTVFILVGSPYDIFQALALASGKMPLFPKWAYGFTNSQWGTNQELLREYLETYRALDIPIDNFTLDFDWKDWGASHYGEFRWNPVKYSQALYTPDNPDALINWTRELECKITGIMKPRIIISTVKGRIEPMTTQGLAAKKLDIYLPGEKPFADYFSHLMSLDVDFYKPICRQWYWHATWSHQCMQHGIAGFWNDEADYGNMGNFEFMHMQQSLYEGQRRDRPEHRVWSINRNFYLGSQRYAYATWSGDINTGFEVMRLQTLAMINTINLGQMRWAQDTGGFNGHPSPECYARWFQFTAVCPTLRTHCTLGERRQPWVFGDQACETVKQAIRQRYSWFFYVYALEHAACTHTGVGIVRPLTFDYPADRHVAAITDQWMFGPWMMAAPVVEEMPSGKNQSATRKMYLPPGDWIDYFRGDRLTGGQWIHYPLNEDSWMDWPLFIKNGAIIPTADPVKAIHTAKPEMIYLDIYPAAQRSQGEFYDDDGDSYDYQHGQFHRQIISAVAHANGTDIELSANAGAYRSTVKHFILRVHGHAADAVTVNGQAVNPVESRYALSQAPGGWHTDVDVIGDLTLIKVPAGEKVEVHLRGMRQVHKKVEVLTSSDASIFGPTPPTVPLKTGNSMYSDTHLFGPSPSLRPVVMTNHTGYAAGGFIAGFELPGTGAAYYLRRHKAGRYRVVFRVANADINTIKTMNVYVNGIMAGELSIASTASWDTWQNIAMYLPLAAGNNTIMLRHDENNTGKINLDTLTVPREPLM